jgi:transposase
MFFIGIDVHKKQSQICVLDEQGKVLSELRVPTTRPDLADVLGSYAPTARVLIESSTPSEWVARHLESLGLDVIVADPNFAPMYASRQKKIKTDRRDARMLAEAAWRQTYRPAHRISDEKRQLRLELGAREALVNNRTQLLCFVRAQLLGEGHRVADCAAENFVRHVRLVELPSALTATLEPLLQVLDLLTAQILRQDEQVEKLAYAEPQACLLQTIPGVGVITALSVLVAIDGPQRFAGAHQLASYLGLVPRESSSGEKQRRGPISKAGNGRARRMLVQAAQRMLRSQNETTRPLWQWAQQIQHRRGKNIAVVALSRKLVGVIFAMLRDQKEFQGAPPGPGPAPVQRGRSGAKAQAGPGRQTPALAPAARASA